MNAKYLVLLLLFAGLVYADEETSAAVDDNTEKGSTEDSGTSEEEDGPKLTRIPLKPASSYGYVAEIQLGTPPQAVNVVIDSGSSDLWVGASDLCSTVKDYCKKHRVFDTKASSSYEKLNVPEFQIRYTVGAARGPVGRDILRFGDREMKINFATVTNATEKMLTNGNMDGCLGVSFLSLASIRSEFPNTTNPLNLPIFSFYFAKDGEEGSELILGGSDPNHYEGELQYAPLNSIYQMRINMTSFRVRDMELCKETCKVVIDTGSAGIVVPKSKFALLMQRIPGFPIPCEQNHFLHSISMQLGDYNYTLESNYYMGKYPPDPDSGKCVFLVSRHGDDQPWVLGDTFLRKYYSEFDLNNKRIGLALAKHD